EFLQSYACGSPRRVFRSAIWKEAIENDLLDFLRSEMRGQRCAHQPAAFTDHGYVIIFRRTLAQQRFFRKPAELHELAPLRRSEFAFGFHPFLGAAANGGIHVVAAQHQMIANGDSPQRLSFADFDQREVRSSSADVNNEHQLYTLELGFEMMTVI